MPLKRKGRLKAFAGGGLIQVITNQMSGNSSSKTYDLVWPVRSSTQQCTTNVRFDFRLVIAFVPAASYSDWRRYCSAVNLILERDDRRTLAMDRRQLSIKQRMHATNHGSHHHQICLARSLVTCSHLAARIILYRVWAIFYFYFF